MKTRPRHGILPLLLLLLTGAGSATGANLVDIVNTHLRGQLAAEPGRLEIAVKASRAQINKAQRCQQLNAFDPPGQKLTRRGYVGVECVATPPWRMWVPVRIQRFAQAAISARRLTRGTTIVAADIALVEIDVATLPADTVIDPAKLIGKEPTQSIAAGRPILGRQVRGLRLVRRGDAVQVTIVGPGYEAANRGIAVSEGEMDENVRVRMPSGAILGGRVTGFGQIEVAR